LGKDFLKASFKDDIFLKDQADLMIFLISHIQMVMKIVCDQM